jgi:hypothetical protein
MPHPDTQAFDFLRVLAEARVAIAAVLEWDEARAILAA